MIMPQTTTEWIVFIVLSAIAIITECVLFYLYWSYICERYNKK